MKYFYIFGNICSILGFIAVIYQLSGRTILPNYFKIIISWLISLTIVFWLYFYTFPHNKLAKYIEKQTDFTGQYVDSENQTLDVVEGNFEVSSMNWSTSVELPPFEEQPEVQILYCKNKERKNYPEIVIITKDYFVVRARSSSQTGIWKWRARGKLLKRQVENENINPK